MLSVVSHSEPQSPVWVQLEDFRSIIKRFQSDVGPLSMSSLAYSMPVHRARNHLLDALLNVLFANDSYFIKSDKLF